MIRHTATWTFGTAAGCGRWRVDAPGLYTARRVARCGATLLPPSPILGFIKFIHSVVNMTWHGAVGRTPGAAEYRWGAEEDW